VIVCVVVSVLSLFFLVNMIKTSPIKLSHNIQTVLASKIYHIYIKKYNIVVHVSFSNVNKNNFDC